MKRRVLLGSSIGLLLAACRTAPAPTAGPSAVVPKITPRAAPTVTMTPSTVASAAAARAVATTTVVTSPRDLLYVRNDYGVRGPGEIAVVDVAAGRAVRSLPVGLAARDWSALYATTWSGGKTTLTAVDPKSGATIRQTTLDGVYDAVAVSPNGQWLALQREVSRDEAQAFEKANRWETHLRVLDQAFARPKEVALDGNFWVDALSDDGTALYLIENLPPIQPSQYQVRLYDLARDTLQEGAIAYKTGSEVMSGTRTASHVSPDGAWLYSLYLNQTKGPFIHALSLAQRFAVCIFLPSDGKDDYEKLLLWSTALAPDGKTLYAANGALGLAATLDMTQLQVTRTAKLSPPTAASPSLVARLSAWLAPTAQAKRLMMGGAGLSPDGSTLYVVGDTGLLAIAAADLSVRGAYLKGLALNSIALDPSGARLYVVDAELATIYALDPRSGEVLAVVQGADHPAGLLRVEAA